MAQKQMNEYKTAIEKAENCAEMIETAVKLKIDIYETARDLKMALK